MPLGLLKRMENDKMLNFERYQRNPVVDYPQRQWPNREIEHAPIWCSVDLRDGNQALIEPMTVERKIEFFKLLVKIGFKEIEVGFPAASQIEFDFLRELVKQDLIPDDVVIQVLVQCRDHLITRTFEALEGVKKAVVHIYNSTSTLQRDVVFHMDKEQIKRIAIDGTRMVKSHLDEFAGEVILEYSPESFTGTELDYAAEVCNAVIQEWGPDPEHKLIINLPSTVEMNTPNVYADQIEWMIGHLDNRESVVVSVHPHNDRGTGVAAAELALLAGADRVEGTLFGNGERTGNVDIVNLAYNMFSQGIDPKLALDDVNELIDVYQRCCRIEIHPRHPYAGKLVFTAFSGSHQDAINKGVQAMKERGSEHWQVPYLPIDPSDIGRQYEPIVRINSQSGKGGVAFVMDTYYGYQLPKKMHREFADVVQKVAEQTGEVSPEKVYELFQREYIFAKSPYRLVNCVIAEADEGEEEQKEDCTNVTLTLKKDGEVIVMEGTGIGPMNAVRNCLQELTGMKLRVLDYTEHALDEGSEARAAAYVQCMNLETGETTFGVGTSHNITRASLKALFSAVNRLYRHCQ